MKITMNEAFGTGMKGNMRSAYKDVEEAYLTLKRAKSNLDILDDDYKPTQEELENFRKVYIYVEHAYKVFKEWLDSKYDDDSLKRNYYKRQRDEKEKRKNGEK